MEKAADLSLEKVTIWLYISKPDSFLMKACQFIKSSYKFLINGTAEKHFKIIFQQQGASKLFVAIKFLTGVNGIS